MCSDLHQETAGVPEANLEFTSRLARASGAPATEEFARGYRNAHLETAKAHGSCAPKERFKLGA